MTIRKSITGSIQAFMMKVPFLKNLIYKISYRHHSGHRLNMENPQTWSEKLIWLTKYWQPELKSKGADKYEARDYVRNKGLEDILLDVYGVWDDANKIDFDILPQRFVLKCNHGCGWNIICEDKSKLDIEKSIAQLNKWMKIDFGSITPEKHYHYIKPLIMCEQFLPVENYRDVKDYKIHCFNGVPKFIGVCYDRDIVTRHSQGVIYSTDWKRLYYLKDDDPNDNVNIERPTALERLLEVSKKLSEGIPYVRVDLYAVEDKVFFGELTFSPDGNIVDREYTYETTVEMGKYIDLPEKISRK